VQTALVVGPSSEEIYTDKYGRIKVQFYWDRLGSTDNNSSCWLRVATPWAGKNWGAVHIPRIGQEVVVEGVISDVGYSARSDTTFLRMGGKYPNHAFTAVIFKSAKPLFPEARSWEGKKERIRGVVKEYRGKPEIVLERAEQVNVPR